MEKILFLGASQYYKKSIEAIRRYGYKVIVIDRDPSSPGFQVAHAHAVIDITDMEKALTFASDNKIDGVLAMNDFGVRTASFVSRKLGLPGISFSTAKMATDKALMRKKWSENGVPGPEYFVTDKFRLARSKIKMEALPVIVKPVDSRGGGSRGVQVVFDMQDLEKAFLYAQSFYRDKRVIIEDYIHGDEYSAEVLVIKKKVHIIALGNNKKTPYPYRVNRKIIYPAEVSRRDFKNIEDVINQAVQSIGISHGVCHIEMVLTEQGPIIFEIGARCGGGAIPQLVEAYTGIQYLKLAVKIALGESINVHDLKPKLSKGAVYHFFIFNKRTDCIKKTIGFKKAHKFREIIDIDLNVSPGEKLHEVRTGLDRHGFAVIIADDKKQALKISHFLDRHIDVQ